MKLTRIDDNTFSCHLNAEDLSSFGVSIKDFMENNKVAENVINNILENYRVEYGDSFASTMILINIRSLDNGDIEILLSDARDQLNSLVFKILMATKTLLEHPYMSTDDKKKVIDTVLDDKLLRSSKGLVEDIEKFRQLGEFNNSNENKTDENSDRDFEEKKDVVLEFDDIRNIYEYVNCITNIYPEYEFDTTYLYGGGDFYYLFINCMDLDEKMISNLCFYGYEFGNEIKIDDETVISIVTENQLLIDGNAIDVFKKKKE